VQVTTRHKQLVTDLYNNWNVGATSNNAHTRNTLDYHQSNYSSRIVFSHIPTEFGQTAISAIRSADPENPILEPNTE